MSQGPSKATFITFYSFKGGVGRSMALINTAAMLAGRGLGVVRRGFRVLVLDLDLEAPGLSYLVNREAPGAPPVGAGTADPPQPGIVDLLGDAKERGSQSDLFALSPEEIVRRYTRPYLFADHLDESVEGSLDIMPAGRFDGEYTRRFDKLDLRQLYHDGLGEPLIRIFKNKLADAGLYDYVLVDSRTGFSDEAGICTRDLADFLIILSGLNRQNVEGTCDFLRALRAATAGQKPIRIVLSPVPTGEDDLLDRREAEAKSAFEKAWGTEVDLTLQIPYHPKLALTEEPHISRRRRGPLFEAYRGITRHMLSAIGHDTPGLTRIIKNTLRRKDYAETLSSLSILVRLEEGPLAVAKIAGDLVMADAEEWPEKAEAKPGEQPSSLETILREDKGRRVLEFLIEQIPVDGVGWEIQRLLARLDGPLPGAVDAFFERLPQATPGTASLLGDHAVTLETRYESLSRARLYYERAVAAGPDDVRPLVIYAIFLDERGEVDAARACYERAVAAGPDNVRTLGNYALFLERRGESDAAWVYYERAVAASPNNADILGNYAIFLDKRGEVDAARACYERAVAAVPDDATMLGNYGQFLVGQAQYERGEEMLLAALGLIDRSNAANVAEVCFSLWVVSRIQGRDAALWERGFKYELRQGFRRSPWSFDGMLRRAEPILTPEDFSYARAMAAAFLDEARVIDLDAHERWRELEPLDPTTR